MQASSTVAQCHPDWTRQVLYHRATMPRSKLRRYVLERQRAFALLKHSRYARAYHHRPMQAICHRATMPARRLRYYQDSRYKLAMSDPSRHPRPSPSCQIVQGYLPQRLLFPKQYTCHRATMPPTRRGHYWLYRSGPFALMWHSKSVRCYHS